MTTLEKFVSFAENLPSNNRADIEQVLVQLMASYSQDSLLTPEQTFEVKRRMADPTRKLASRESIEAIFGKSLPA